MMKSPGIMEKTEFHIARCITGLSPKTISLKVRTTSSTPLHTYFPSKGLYVLKISVKLSKFTYSQKTRK